MNIKTNYVLNIESEKINKNYFLYYTDSLKLKGYNFHNINQMTINTISDRCNVTYEQYLNQPMSMDERQTSFNIAKNPELINTLDRTKNHPLIGKYLHIPFVN